MSIENSLSTSSAGSDEKPSVELSELLQKHEEIRSWSRLVDKRIREIETVYLEETPLGNIVKGWEIDGRHMSVRARPQPDEKERLFSSSSHYDSTGRPRRRISSGKKEHNVNLGGDEKQQSLSAMGGKSNINGVSGTTTQQSQQQQGPAPKGNNKKTRKRKAAALVAADASTLQDGDLHVPTDEDFEE